MNFDDKLSILLVEDNDLNQRLMKISLTRYKYIVTVAVNGLEGVQLFKNQKFDLILMDIMMPVMDGFEATKEIRNIESQDASLGHTPILAFTANTININREMCVRGGMDNIIEKPFDINTFREILSSLP